MVENKDPPFGLFVSYPTQFNGEYDGDRLKWYASVKHKDVVLTAEVRLFLSLFFPTLPNNFWDLTPFSLFAYLVVGGCLSTARVGTHAPAPASLPDPCRSDIHDAKQEYPFPSFAFVLSSP